MEAHDYIRKKIGVSNADSIREICKNLDIEDVIDLMEGYSSIENKITPTKELLSFINKVAHYNQPHVSRELKLEAREIIKFNCW